MLRCGFAHDYLAGHLIAALSGATGALGWQSPNYLLKGELK
jgi:hypothetical protein